MESQDSPHGSPEERKGEGNRPKVEQRRRGGKCDEDEGRSEEEKRKMKITMFPKE